MTAIPLVGDDDFACLGCHVWFEHDEAWTVDGQPVALCQQCGAGPVTQDVTQPVTQEAL